PNSHYLSTHHRPPRLSRLPYTTLFRSQLDPTMDELTEIKTVVSEAVTNAIIHGYNSEPNHKISLSCVIDEREVEQTVTDHGVGIDRKSTRLNSSHVSISYAVFCLKKKT